LADGVVPSRQVLEFGQVGEYFTGWPLDRDRVGKPHRSHPLLATGTAMEPLADHRQVRDGILTAANTVGGR
jgi:hypothetical protein